MNTSGLAVGPITCVEKIQWEPVFYRTIFWSLTHYVLVFIALFSCSRSSQLQARYSVLGFKRQTYCDFLYMYTRPPLLNTHSESTELGGALRNFSTIGTNGLKVSLWAFHQTGDRLFCGFLAEPDSVQFLFQPSALTIMHNMYFHYFCQ